MADNIYSTLLAQAQPSQQFSSLKTNKLYLGSTPKASSFNNVPQAASITNTAANTSDKARGGLNLGQTLALTSGALGMMGDFAQSRYSARALRAQANAYESQMGLNYEAYRTNAGYIAEQNFASVSRIISDYSAFEGQQKAAMGASGFDVSTGDQRIIKDTRDKMANEVYLANRSAQLEAFELWRSTEIENARLKAAAAMARSQAKYVKKMGKINLIAGAVNTAANVWSLGSYGRTGDVNVKGAKNADTSSR